MDNKFEKLVLEIMKEAEKDGEPVTREEAEEMAKMEIGSKEVSREARSAAPSTSGTAKKRTVKISDEKKELFESILENLTRCVPIERENITVLKENKLIQVRIGDKTFKIDVVECRNKTK
jgi:hypothetical protein